MSNEPMCGKCKASEEIPAKGCETPDECVEECLGTYTDIDTEKKSVGKITTKGPSGIVRK